MNCGNCLTSLTPETRFCPTCGMAVGSPLAQAPTTPAPVVQPAPVPASQYAPIEQPVPPASPQQQYAPAQTSTNGLAIASLVLGLTGISIVGLVLGYIARKQIRESGGRQDGAGLATAGIVLGWIGTILGIIFIVAYVAFIGVLISNDPSIFSDELYY